MSVTAEGVETNEQADYLAGLGCARLGVGAPRPADGDDEPGRLPVSGRAVGSAATRALASPASESARCTRRPPSDCRRGSPWTRNGRGFALLSSACEGSSPLPVDALLHIARTLTMQP